MSTPPLRRSVRSFRPTPWLGTLALGAAAAFAPAALAAPQDDAPTAPTAEVAPVPVYPVSAFNLAYLRENPLQPAVSELAAVSFELGRTERGFSAPFDGLERTTMTLATLPADGIYDATAILHINTVLRDELLRRDLFGIQCFPDPLQINRDGVDLRGDGERGLTILIATGIVTELRTVAFGERVEEGGEIEPDDSVNHPLHQRYIDDSPFRPHADDADGAARSNLLKKSELDRYLFFLGRHPGRIVDVTVAAAQDIGGVALDYRITENRPLVLYAEVSNTGTANTDYWRERFGLLHTQLTNNDDILSVDYTTANFDEVNTLFASYERPWFDNERVRWSVSGYWNEYTSSDVGVFNDEFSGESWNLTAQMIWNFYQQRELFLDAVAGVRFDSLTVDNPGFFIEGEEELITPFVGLRLDRTTDWFSTQASLSLDFQPELSSVDTGELTRLGRTAPDESWAILRFNARHSVFLEPLVDRVAWEDPSTPESSTLAHEILLNVRGQYSFGNRLIPQEQQVAGGLYSVRGYPQSVIAGDDALIATAEYRFHLPRAFEIEPTPRELFGEPFRAAPQFVYGVPEWDLILKGFIDVAWTDNSDALSFEDSESLIGAGIGLEFLYKRNLNVRLDWGFALEELEDRNVDSGANRLHLVATILF